MNGVLVIPQPRLSPRERMITVLDALALGLYPEGGCPDCRMSLAQWCEACAAKVADYDRVNRAIGEVQDARDDAEAERAFWDCMGDLTGLTADGGNW